MIWQNKKGSAKKLHTFDSLAQLPCYVSYMLHVIRLIIVVLLYSTHTQTHTYTSLTAIIQVLLGVFLSPTWKWTTIWGFSATLLALLLMKTITMQLLPRSVRPTRLETTSRKILPYVVESHWSISKTAEYRSFLCMEEDDPSRKLAFDCHAYGTPHTKCNYSQKFVNW